MSRRWPSLIWQGFRRTFGIVRRRGGQAGGRRRASRRQWRTGRWGGLANRPRRETDLERVTVARQHGTRVGSCDHARVPVRDWRTRSLPPLSLTGAERIRAQTGTPDGWARGGQPHVDLGPSNAAGSSPPRPAAACMGRCSVRSPSRPQRAMCQPPDARRGFSGSFPPARMRRPHQFARPRPQLAVRSHRRFRRGCCSLPKRCRGRVGLK